MLKKLLLVCAAALALAGCSKFGDDSISKEDAARITEDWYLDKPHTHAAISSKIIEAGKTVAKESFTDKILLKAKQRCWVVVVNPNTNANCICNIIYLLVDASSGYVAEHTFDNAITNVDMDAEPLY